MRMIADVLQRSGWHQKNKKFGKDENGKQIVRKVYSRVPPGIKKNPSDIWDDAIDDILGE